MSSYTGGDEIDFYELEDALLAVSKDLSPAILHGHLSGFLASGSQLTLHNWLRTVQDAWLGTFETSGVLGALLQNLYSFTAATIDSDALEFALFLPSDEVDLEDRLEALAAWCEGFIQGFTSDEKILSDWASLSDDISELLSDIAQIGQLDPDDANDEEAESNYFSLCEHVRLGVSQACFEMKAVENSSPQLH